MNKPVIKVPITKVDWLLETIGAIALLTLLIISALGYSSAPETIPVHFKATGEADGFGTRQNIWIISIATTVLYIALTVLERFPHKFNYMLEITYENAERQYRNMLYMMRIIKVLMAIIFLFITYNVTQDTPGNQQNLGAWFFPVIIICLLGTVAIFIVRGARLK